MGEGERITYRSLSNDRLPFFSRKPDRTQQKPLASGAFLLKGSCPWHIQLRPDNNVIRAATAAATTTTEGIYRLRISLRFNTGQGLSDHAEHEISIGIDNQEGRKTALTPSLSSDPEISTDTDSMASLWPF